MKNIRHNIDHQNRKKKLTLPLLFPQHLLFRSNDEHEYNFVHI